MDEINDDENENNNNNRLHNNKKVTSKSFKYKAKVIGSTPDNRSKWKSYCSIKIFE